LLVYINVFICNKTEDIKLYDYNDNIFNYVKTLIDNIIGGNEQIYCMSKNDDLFKLPFYNNIVYKREIIKIYNIFNDDDDEPILLYTFIITK